MKKMILASASPRRIELLHQIGIEAEVRPAHADESFSEELTPSEIVEELSQRKAAAAFEEYLSSEGFGKEQANGPESIEEADQEDKEQANGPESADDHGTVILAADTVVSIHGKILGKPADEEDAYRMLKLLSGKRNIVYTGVTLLSICGGEIVKKDVFHSATSVYIFPMTREEILDYIRSGEPMDKAGAYGIQGIFGRYVKRIEGDYNNVVGLPAAEVYQHLKGLEEEPEREELE